jgi:hypothetical protein
MMLAALNDACGTPPGKSLPHEHANAEPAVATAATTRREHRRSLLKIIENTRKAALLDSAYALLIEMKSGAIRAGVEWPQAIAAAR